MNRNKSRLFTPRAMGWSALMLSIPFFILAFAGWYKLDWLEALDTNVGLAVTQYRAVSLTQFFRIMTELGGVAFSVVLILLVFIYLYVKMGRRDFAIWFALTVSLGAGVLNQLAKFLFQRPRPLIEHLVHQGGYSFPSGHSMGSMIMYGALVFLVVNLVTSRTIKWVSLLVALVIVLMVGLSRIYLGVHFPSDVIGGYSLGAAWLACCIGGYGVWESRRE